MGMVALSILVPILMSMMALHTAKMASVTANKKYKRVALGLGALALGVGIWVMHFIAMMAFMLPVPVSYDLVLTAVSILPACAASGIALRILAQRRRPTTLQYISSGLFVGIGIGLMHYVGMMAMIIPLSMHHEPILFVVSIALAIVLAIIALWIRFGLEQFKWPPVWRFIISGVVMGCAISGMHYTAMFAVRFYGEPLVQPEYGLWVHTGLIALGLSSMVLTIGIMVIALNGWVRSRELYNEMQRNKSRLQALLDTAVDPIVAINEYGIIQDFNKAAVNLLGYQTHEVIGRNVKMLMPDPYRTEHDGYLENYRTTQQAKIIGTGREVVAQHKDGRYIPIRLAVGKVHSTPGEEQLFVGLITDISERHALEASLRETAVRAEQAAQVKSRFLANMSHEIRTPMNAIIGFSELLLQTDLNATQRSHLNNITQSSRALLRLINDILDSTKIEEGKLELEITDFSLKAIAMQLESSMGLLAKKCHLELQIRYAPTMPEYFKGDGIRIVQVLNNLVGNAIKFTEKGGVYVDFDYDEHEVSIQIVDTGIGMSPDQLAILFDPFTQADASINRRFGGTGLGTTIAHQLVEAMGGRIQVCSQLDKGSRFRVYLPLKPGQKPHNQPAPTTQLPSMHILIVDDVEQNLRLLQLILEKHGHSVDTAADGQQAVEKYHSHRYDLILMDMHMPGMDGLQATYVIRQYERQHHLTPLPIITLTASVMETDRQQAAAAGMDGFAIKPIDINQLFTEIARVLHQRPTATAPITESSVPTETLIDWQAGSHLWQGRENLKAELHRFLELPVSQALTLAQAQALDDDALYMHVHRLRGVAANLFLTSIAALTAEFEELLHNQKREQVLNRWHELNHALHQVQQLLTTTHSAHDARPLKKTPATVDSSAFFNSDLYSQLLSSLQRNEFNSTLIEQVCTQLPATQAQQLRDTIDAFDFEAAYHLLAHWQQNALASSTEI